MMIENRSEYDYSRIMDENKILDEYELDELLLQAKYDKEAVKKIVNSFLKAVKWTISRFHVNKNDEEDLFQIGCIGLLDAIKTYDSKKNTKFNTYAFSKIRNSVLNEFQKNEKFNKIISLDKEIFDKVDMIDTMGYEEHHETTYTVVNFLNNLDGKEKDIILRIADGDTYREIGESYNMTPQGIYKIRNKICDTYMDILG